MAVQNRNIVSSFILALGLISICAAQNIPPTDTVPLSAAMETNVISDSIGVSDKDTVFVLTRDEEPADTVKKDTILVLTKQDTESFLDLVKGEVRNSRQRGFGGALGVVPGFNAVHMRPVYDLIKHYPDLRGIGFDIKDKYEGFVSMGGMGYGGLGNGLRIGGGGSGAERGFSAVKNDTAYLLDVSIGWGGVIIEKAFVRKDLNVFVGTMIGGGGIGVELRTSSSSSFINLDDDLSDVLPMGEAHASFLLTELHGGFTWSLLSWMHAGFDLTVPAFISGSGFRVGSQSGITGGFVTVNPGLKLRIMLGNLG